MKCYMQNVEPIGGPYSRPLADRVNQMLQVMFASLHREGLNGGGTLSVADKKFEREIQRSLDICGVSLMDVRTFNGKDRDVSDDEDEEIIDEDDEDDIENGE